METNEMLEILWGKPIHGLSVKEIQAKLDEIADYPERLERERDAAVRSLEDTQFCDDCKFCDLQTHSCIDKHDVCNAKESHWEWRGVQDE